MSVYGMVIARMGNLPVAQEMLTIAKVSEYWRRNYYQERERHDADFERLCCRSSELRRAKRDIGVLSDLNESYQAIIDDIDHGFVRAKTAAFVIGSLTSILIAAYVSMRFL